MASELEREVKELRTANEILKKGEPLSAIYGVDGPAISRRMTRLMRRRFAKRYHALRCGLSPVKSEDRQALLMTHVAPEVRLRRNARKFLVRQQTQIVNASCWKHAFGTSPRASRMSSV